MAQSDSAAPTPDRKPKKTRSPRGASQASPGSAVSARAAPGASSREATNPPRVVTLELLRHGPDHNQLLSPLTPYLALCGNRDPVTFHLGFEHLHLLRRIQLLRYEAGLEMSSIAQSEAAAEIARLLGSIQPLTAELVDTDPVEQGRMVHLRLVLSASELALLPFELSHAIPGMAEQKRPLCRQTVNPICLTREVRRVATGAMEWPQKVRILVISAAPPPVGPVPLREHVQALRTALAPYIVHEQHRGEEEFRRLVTVLPEATIADVLRVCRENREAPFTHVHVLAHGISTDAPGYAGSRYGLAFHSENNPHEADIVDGDTLVEALCGHTPNSPEQAMARPAVVTIASCDSANMGTHSVLSAGGASIAHELHEAGIPLVIGSQFPLSVKGSVVMARLLYQRLLQGHDPRMVIHDLRQTLHAEVREAPNDWAAIVVYAAFPADLPAQLARVRFERTRLELDTVMSRIDAFDEDKAKAANAQAKAADDGRRQELLRELMRLMGRLREAMPTDGSNTERIHALGVLASAGKQIVRFLTEDGSHGHSAGESGDAEELVEALRKAQRDYYDCYQAGNIDSWPLVQYLSLTGRLEKQWDTQEFQNRWKAAYVMSQDALLSKSLQRRAWALSALAELHILEAAWDSPEACSTRALKNIREFYAIINLEPYKDARFDAYSLYRQVRRYRRNVWGTEAMVQVAEKVGAELKKRGAKHHWTRLP